MRPWSQLWSPGSEETDGASEAGPTRQRWFLHTSLFFLTLASTTFTGGITYLFAVDPIPYPDFVEVFLVKGISFGGSIMAILLAHEGGHYLMARRHKLDVSLPFFIPAPLTPFGTFGAFIRIREQIFSRKALMDVGAAGPLAGMVVTLHVLAVGLSLSPVISLSELQGGLTEGNSLIYLLWKALFSDIPDGHDVLLHPMAFAGWGGLLITFLNLFPIGQLDGGHVTFALTPGRHPTVARAAFGALLGLAIGDYLIHGNYGWFFWIGLIYFLVRFDHPPLAPPEQSLSTNRAVAGVLCLICFALTFTPFPLTINEGGQDEGSVPSLRHPQAAGQDPALTGSGGDVCELRSLDPTEHRLRGANGSTGRERWGDAAGYAGRGGRGGQDQLGAGATTGDGWQTRGRRRALSEVRPGPGQAELL